MVDETISPPGAIVGAAASAATSPTTRPRERDSEEARMNQTARPRLVGINHVALKVSNVDEALRFWAQLFELGTPHRETGAAFLGLGDQFIALFDQAAPPEESEPHFGLVVDDKEKVRRVLERAQVEILPGPRLDFRDPYGNRIQVVQYDQIQFMKAPQVLDALHLSPDKRPSVIAELRANGIAAPDCGSRSKI